MQNDLISRSALIEALHEEDKKYPVSVPGFLIAMRVAEKQPTAYDVEKAKTPTPTHPIPLDTQIYIQELESRYEMILKRMEEYEYTHLIEHDSEQAKHCEGADDCEYSDCLLCLWAKAKAIVRNCGKE